MATIEMPTAKERKTAPSVPQPVPEKKPRSRFKWLIVAGIVIAMIWMAPLLIGWSPLRQTVVNMLSKKFNGHIYVDGATWSWFSPVQLSGIRAEDDDGLLLISANNVVCSNSLINVLLSGELGQISVDQLEANWVLRTDGSNIEDAIAGYLSDGSESESSPIRIDVEDSTIYLSANETPVYKFSKVLATIFVNDESAPISITARGNSESDSVHPGTFEADVKIGSWQDDGAEYRSGSMQLKTDQFQCRTLMPVANRFFSGLAVTGLLNADARVGWHNYTERITIAANSLTASNVKLNYQPYFGTDTILANTLHAKGHMEIAGLLLRADKFDANTEFANVQADGTVDIAKLLSIFKGQNRLESDFEFTGNANLPLVAAMLPETLRLQEGVQIDNGKIQFTAHSRQHGMYRDTIVNLELVNFNAKRGQTRFSSQQPIRFAATIQQDKTQARIENLLCQSDFCNIQGKASINSGSVSVDADLRKMADQLKQFVNFGDATFDGQMNGRISWDTPGADINFETGIKSGAVHFGGNLVLNQFVVAIPNGFEIREPKMEMVVEADGTIDGVNQFTLSNASADVKAGNDRLTIVTTAPLDLYQLDKPIYATAQLQGNLQNWRARLSPFVDLSAIQLAGDANLTADTTIAGDEITVKNGKFEVSQFQFAGVSLDLREPKVVGEVSGRYSFADSQLRVPEATLVSSSIALRAQNINIKTARSLESTGQVAFRGDLNRLTHWFGQPESDSIQWFGNLEGNASLQSDANGINGTIRATAKNLVAAKATQTATPQNANTSQNNAGMQVLWKEENADIGTSFVIDTNSQSLLIDRMSLASNSLVLEGRGSINELTSKLNAQLEGQWNPNWNQLANLVSEATAGQVKIEGGSAQAFKVNGPLLPGSAGNGNQSFLSKELGATATISWNRASLLGIPVGVADIQTELKNNRLFVHPTSIPVGKGKLNLAPELALSGPQMILSHPKGKLIDNVELTPEICRGWLRYIAPLLADSTEVRGQFSVVTDEIRMPISDPWSAQLKGGITIHQATLGPGPLSRQLIQAAEIVKSIMAGNPLQNQPAPGNKTWIVMSEQSIPIEVKDQRIYHNGVVFNIGDVEIRTRGFVAKDQSINLTAEIPVRDQWVKDKAWLSGLKGTTFKLPISGTLSEPRIDNSVLQQASQNLLKNMAGNVIKDQVENRLNNEVDKGMKKLDDELKKGFRDIFGGK